MSNQVDIKVMPSAGFAIKDIENDLPKHEDFPNGKGTSAYQKHDNRKIKNIIIHQTAGGYTKGIKAVENTTRYLIDHRGFPGCAYHFYIPYFGERTANGLPIIYQCWDMNWETWHTKGANKHGIGIAFQGYFESRHIKDFEPAGEGLQYLSDFQKEVRDKFIPFWQGQLHAELQGHFDYSKPACPGDELEIWIRNKRGTSKFSELRKETVPTKKWLLIQEALYLLGFNKKVNVDGKYGEETRAAIERFQQFACLVVDGVWGEITGSECNRMLQALFLPVVAEGLNNRGLVVNELWELLYKAYSTKV